MHKLKFWLLGTLEIWRGDMRLDPAVPGTRALALLGILLTARNRYVAADYIMEHLWSHLDVDAAVNNVQVAVRKLRRWLEPEVTRGPASCYVVTEPGGYRLLTESCFVDVDEFMREVRQGESARCAEH